MHHCFWKSGRSTRGHDQRITGVLSPVVTPFRKDLSPDTDRFVRHCKWLLGHGCSGLAVFGTNSEAASLSTGEDQPADLGVHDALTASKRCCPVKSRKCLPEARRLMVQFVMTPPIQRTFRVSVAGMLNMIVWYSFTRTPRQR